MKLFYTICLSIEKKNSFNGYVWARSEMLEEKYFHEITSKEIFRTKFCKQYLIWKE